MTESKYVIREAEVDKINIITWNQEIEQERKSAVFDLLNNGKFKLYNKKIIIQYENNPDNIVAVSYTHIRAHET